MEKVPKVHTESQTEKVKEYQEKYLPENLRSQKKVNLLIATGLEAVYARKAEVHGSEYLPESGPFIVVANHFNVKETEILLATLKDYDAHMVAAERVIGGHWFGKHALKAIRGITVPESLKHLSEDEKKDLLNRIPSSYIRRKYTETIEQEPDRASLIKFIRSSVALLSRGDVLVIYPEGLWLYDGENGEPRAHSLYRGNEGFTIIAEQYKKLCGQELPIVPVSVSETKEGKKVSIGKAQTLSENNTELSATDWFMTHIAEMLPEEQRGYYSET